MKLICNVLIIMGLALVCASANEGATQLVFEARVSDLAMSAIQIEKGKKPEDVLTVSLPGTLYDTPIKVIQAPKAQVDRSTPVKAAISDYFAYRANDADWIIHNWAPKEREQMKKMLAIPMIRERNKQMMDAKKSMEIWGEAHYKDYALVLVNYNGAKEQGLVLTFKKIDGEWLRTNALSSDESMDVVSISFWGKGKISQNKK